MSIDLSVSKQIKVYLRKQGVSLGEVDVYLIGSSADDSSCLNHDSDIDILIQPPADEIMSGEVFENVIQIDGNKHNLHVNYGDLIEDKPYEKIV